MPPPPPPPPRHFPLLSLPYELRQEIYKFSLALQLSSYAIYRQGNKQEATHASIFLPYSQNKESNLPIGPPDRGFCALRLASQQLAFETASLIHIPGIVLNAVWDDLSMKLCNEPRVLEWLSQKWVRENLVSVNLHFTFSGDNAYPYRGEQLVKRYPSTSVILLRKLCWALGLAKGYWMYDWEFAFVPRQTLSPLCKALEKCPKLEKLELVTDHEAFFDIWKDPLGDLIAMRPLVERGVEVQIGTQNCGQWRRFWEMKDRMMSKWGWGWVRWYFFGGGMRWRLVKSEFAHEPGRGPRWHILCSGANKWGCTWKLDENDGDLNSLGSTESLLNEV